MNSQFHHYPRALTLTAMHLMAAAGALAGSDFNNDGFEDLAIGVPGESVGNIASAGIVQVFYGTANGINIAAPADQLFSQDTAGIGGSAEANDRFGAVLATGDFNHDGFDDLAIGVPDEGITINGINKVKAGCVNIIYGSHSGLVSTGNQCWVEGADGLVGAAEANDRFGAALAAGDFDHDGLDDLVIGVPGQKVGVHAEAGAVHVIYGFPTGLNANRNAVITQDSTDILETAETSDHFGSVLAAADFGNNGFSDLAVGVPGEDIVINNVNLQDAGIVQVIYGGANGLSTLDQVWMQGASGIPGNAQTSDGFGSALAAANVKIWDGTTTSILAIGSPADRDSPSASGSVVVLQGNNTIDRLTSANVKMITFDTINAIGTIGPGTHFGQSLVLADFGHNALPLNFTLDLAVGTPGASFAPANGGQEVGGGAVFVIYDIAQDIDPAKVQSLVQGQGAVLDTNENGDGFGSCLAASNFGHSIHADLAVGVPSEDTNLAQVGAVHVLYGSDKGVLGDGGAQVFTQNTTNVEDQCEFDDFFGFALGAGGGIR